MSYVIVMNAHDINYRDETTIIILTTPHMKSADKAVEIITQWMEDYKKEEDRLYSENSVSQAEQMVILHKMKINLIKVLPISILILHRMVYEEWCDYKISIVNVADWEG